MAGKRNSARTVRKKKSIRVMLALFLVFVILAGIVYWLFVYDGGRIARELGLPSLPANGLGETQDGTDLPAIQTGEMLICFPELGNAYAGDCVLIKIGDTEVLIDAGSRAGSAETLVPFVREYCTDGVLEYVIATHAHQDHIAAFVGTEEAPGIFDSFVCEVIIDFPRTDSTAKIYREYCEKRDAEVAAGAVHYTALQCWEEEDGAKRSYSLAENVSMEILYNYYYENKSSEENEYSVCTLFTQGNYHYLFTGDLEEKGEAYLVEYNELPQCKLFKAGHHGSSTSNSDALLSVIRPEIVCICCCAGSPEDSDIAENTFPTQKTVDSLLKYTDQIYVTSQAIAAGPSEFSYGSLNGNIYVRSDGTEIAVTGSNHSLPLVQTPWFSANRTGESG